MTYNLCAWAVTPCLSRHTPGIHVRIGMVTSLNGLIETGGNSKAIGGLADKAAFSKLRSHADAVINTATTVLAENLSPAKNRLHIILTATDKLCTSLPIFKEGVERVIILAGNKVSAERISLWKAAGARVHQVAQHLVDVRWLIEWLRDEHEVERVICEGGRMLNAQMSDAGLVDEWCVTVSTQLLAPAETKTTEHYGIAGPITNPVTLNLRRLLATTTDLVGIYSTHDTNGKMPDVHAA